MLGQGAVVPQPDNQSLIGSGVTDDPGVLRGNRVVAHGERVASGDAGDGGLEPGGGGGGGLHRALGLEGENHVGSLRLRGVSAKVVHHKRDDSHRQQDFGRRSPGVRGKETHFGEFWQYAEMGQKKFCGVYQ